MIFSILHFSDLHQDVNNEIDNTSLVESLYRDVQRFKTSTPAICDPSICVVSGDLIYGARPGTTNFEAELNRQYAQTQDFLVKIADTFFDGDREKLILIPGNHDVCANTYLGSAIRIDVPTKTSEKESLVAEFFRPRTELRWSWKDLCFYRIENRDAYARRLEAFCRCYEQFYLGRRSYSVDSSSQFDFFEYPELRLIIVGLSSCHENDIHNRAGAIHPRCIAEGIRQLRSPRYSGWLMGTTWHHSLFGGPKQDDFLDADVLQSLIDVGVSFGLNGHQHRSTYLDEYFRVGTQNRKISVFSASTLCAGPTQLTPGEPRGYNVIEINQETWCGTLHQRRMINRQFELPIWGPGSFVESGASYLEFSLSPPIGTYSATHEIQNAIEIAETLIAQNKWNEAKKILLGFDDPMSRRLLSEAIENTNDNELAIAKLFPPKSSREAVIVGGAILATGNRDIAQAFCTDDFVSKSSDPSVNEIITRIKQRVLR